MATYDVVILLLAQHQTELWVVGVRFFKLGLEDDHDSVLQEIIELSGVGV